MTMRIPIIPTIFVIAAAATMVALGVWQLGRADEKAELIAQYETALANGEPVAFPKGRDAEELWFRQSTVTCGRVTSSEPVAGTAANGAKGWVMRVKCATGDSVVLVDLGFTQDLAMPGWDGGEVVGVIAPGPRLVANPPVAGLYPLAKPNPGDLPNNHIAYAFQWFFFALTALAIYGFAVRGRLRKRD